ncbi:MAG: SpoIVB peptidase [Oscillospiraceae bacterium]
MEKTGNHWKRRTALALSLLLCLFGLSETNRSYAVPAAACLSLYPAAGQRYLVPVGKAVGVKLFAEGVMVVGLAEGLEGGASPASLCGLTEGDRILAIDGEEIRSTEQVQSLLRQCGGKALTLSVSRDGEERELTLRPEPSGESYRMGAWIRDSMAGIGTMTYYDPESGTFGALGHSINDVDTGLVMPLAEGAVMSAAVTAVRKGGPGEAGELKGEFDLTEDLGQLYDNNECGVFGTMEDCDFVSGEAVPVAHPSQVHTGEATLLTDISGSEAKAYDIEITKLYPFSGNTRNMLVTITDEELLEATGGIVQGMSGSPILQDGRLVGAVTHVLLDDSTKGYAIFIDNMLSAAESGRETVA